VGVLALVLAACGGGGTAAPSPNSTTSNQSADKLATDAAYAFLDSYTTDGGRIQRTDQGGDTVGEGQAYGMLAAAAVDDPSRFNKIWSWTKSNMIRPDGLLAFHWADGRVQDPQAAADADLDAARALLVASCRFKRADLREAAIRIGRAVLTHETAARAGSTDVLLAGPWAAMGRRLVFNPSYLDPATLDALSAVTHDERFSALAAGGIRLVDELARPLPPDWAIVGRGSGRPLPASAATATSGPGMFTYDAPRTLVRLGIDPDMAGRRVAARAWGVFHETRPQDIVAQHGLSGTAVGDVHSSVTLVGAAGAAHAAGDSAAAMTLMDQAQRLDKQHPTYYGGAWVALGRLLLTTTRLEPCTR
jgi:endo-1,4-beta-D-glucanase Y